MGTIPIIDLHIHTTSSDGSAEPEEILKKASQLGLEYISITDHDSIGAYQKLKRNNTRNLFDGKIIPGCEFTAVHNAKPIEILGYGIDLDIIEAAGIVSDEKFLQRESGYLKKLMEVCEDLNITYSKDLSIKGTKYFASQVLHSDLRKYPENEKYLGKDIWENLNAFYRTCVTNESSPFFLDQLKDCLSAEETAGLIKAAGGKAFLAHPYVYFEPDYKVFLDSIVMLNVLDGIECYHSLHSADRTRYLLDYCREHNLYSSGGSDYHGKLKPAVNLGESIRGVKIPYDILGPWLPANLI